MKNFKLLIVGIFGLMLWGSYSFGAEYRVYPSEGFLGKNCIVAFDLTLLMTDGEKAISSDVILESNMEFVGFEKSDLFDYSIPPVVDGNNTILGLFSPNFIEQGGDIGKVYYKVVSDEDPYLDFQFLGQWDTTDTDVNYQGNDILTVVKGGNYTIGLDNSCLDVDESQFKNSETLDDFLLRFTNESTQQVDDDNSGSNIVLVYCGLILLSVCLLLFIILLIHNKKKHEKKN